MKVAIFTFAFAIIDLQAASLSKNENVAVGGVRRALQFLNNVEGNYTVEYLIESNGYPVETHQVTTTDGYILTVHRIPSGNSGTNLGKVAYLQHGILSSSADWCILGAGKGLAFLLADEGYDVWLGNARGNSWSRQHVNLTTADAAFWDFSFHEIGTLDLPAIIDYILAETGVSSIYYAGHSQGTTIYYTLMSEYPEYNDKIVVQASLAPIAYMSHMTSLLLQVLSFWKGTLESFGIHEFILNNEFMKYVVSDKICTEDLITQILCNNNLFLLCGFSRDQINTTLLPIMTKFTPAGASTKQLLHFAQEIKSGYFRQYDHGINSNMLVYGSLTPPVYNLEKVTAPTYLFYSKNDWLSAETDVNQLCSEMGSSCKGKLLISDFSFNHLDYIFGIDAPTLVYNKVISIFARY